MEMELAGNFPQTALDKILKNSVLACLQSDVVQRLDFLVQREGPATCKAILELISHREFSLEEAALCWREIVAHRGKMSAALGRPVELAVAACDYFTLQGQGIFFPKFVDILEFEALKSESQFDFLTGLLNRQALENALHREIGRAERSLCQLSVIFLDLDSFKTLNDLHGHLAGDKMLQQTGKIFAQGKRLVDIAARYGGDEFVMLLPDTSKKEARVVADRIRQAVSEEVLTVEGRAVSLTVSAGIASYPDDGAKGEELFACADNALYRAKRRGGNTVQLYCPEKRRAERVEIVALLIITRIDQTPTRLPPVQGKNLSATGILLASSVPFTAGSRLELEIPLAETKLTLQGQVVRTEKRDQKSFDVGVDFLGPVEKAAALVRDLTGRANKE